MMNVNEKLPTIIKGEVVQGKHMGRTIGFPTINILWSDDSELPYGVYISRVTVDGKAYMGMTNIGCQPTLPAGNITAETYLPDVNLDMYGKTVEVELLCFTRPEKKFENLQALKAQLAADLDETRSYFRNLNNLR